MATVKDVAAYILSTQGPMTSMKLQKLCYYSQAYSLGWYGKPIFENRIEAWTNGPVIPDLWRAHKGEFMVEKIKGGDPTLVDGQDQVVIDVVLESMGGLSGKQLSDRTHAESPWMNNYDGADAFPNGEITHAELSQFYGS